MDTRIDSFRQALDAARARPFHYGLVALICLLLITDGYDTQAIGYVAPALGEAWGVKRAAFAPVFSLGLFGVMIGALATTPLADRIGARRVLLACVAGFGLLSLATALAHDLQSLTILRFLSGVALGGAMPTCIALVSDYAPSRVRVTMVTIAGCGLSVGGAFGGVVATTMIESSGWQAVFVVGGLAPLALLPVLAFMLPESLPRVLSGRAGPRLSRALARAAPGWTPPLVEAAPATRAGHPVAGLFRDGYALSTALIWLVYFLNLLVLYTLSNWLPSIMTAGGLSLKTANFATTFYQVGGAVGAVLIAILCDRLPPRPVLALTFLGASLAVFLIGQAPHDGGLIVAIVCAAGFCVVGGQQAANAFVGNFYPSHVRSSGIGWALGIGRMGSILGPLIVGWLIADGASPRTLFQLCALPSIVAAGAMLLVGRSDADRRG